PRLASAFASLISGDYILQDGARYFNDLLMSDEIVPLKKKPPNPIGSTVFEGTKLTAPREVRQK
ncbi:hypothetical protein, partial [Burkholderia stabilis]